MDVLQSFDETKICIPPVKKHDQNDKQQPNEISIEELLNSIINCLQKDSNSWFKRAHDALPDENNNDELCLLIPQALNYLEYNLKRNNSYINEFEALMKTAQLEQETEQLKAKHQEPVVSKPDHILTTSSLSDKNEGKKKSFLSKRSKSLRTPVEQQPDVVGHNQPLNSQATTSQSKTQHDPLLISEHINMQSQLNLLEQDFMNISYYLSILVKFWSDFSANKHEFNSHLKIFYQNYIEPNQVLLTMLEKYLYQINYKITNKCGSNDLLSLSSISLAPVLLKNQNFLQNFYKYLNYDFLSYKLFTRQLQLIQLTAVLCHIILKIFSHHHKATDNGKTLQFPIDQYRPISWSAQHVTLYSASPKTSKRNLTDCGSSASDQNELLISDLKGFLGLSQMRLNNQADVINNFGYFYVVNKLTGLVLQAVDLDGNQQENAKQPSTKSKGPRFVLRSKLPKANGQNDQQLWYYYLYNGCLANKYIRSSYCMAASSLMPNSPVCLWANVSFHLFF